MKHKALYIGNFELPDKNASANRVAINRKLFEQCDYETYCLGIVRNEYFRGIRKSAFDEAVYERSYPNTVLEWCRQIVSISDVKQLFSNVPQIDCVILYNTPYSFTKKLYKYCKYHGLKLIYECTEWNDFAEGNLIKRLYKKYDEFFVRNRIDSFCDGLIVTSKMMFHSYSNSNIYLLPSVVDTEDSIWHQKSCLSSDTFEFCYAGDPGNKDNLLLLIEAFSALQTQKVKLTIIGIKQEDIDLSNIDLTYEILYNVEFVGRLSHRDTVKRIQNADCFIMTRNINRRNNAGFPLKFVESYTTGISIITTNVSDIADYSGDGLIIINSNCKSEIIDAMNKAIETNLCGQSKPCSIRGTFDYRRQIDSFQQFLDNVN